MLRTKVSIVAALAAIIAMVTGVAPATAAPSAPADAGGAVYGLVYLAPGAAPLVLEPGAVVGPACVPELCPGVTCTLTVDPPQTNFGAQPDGTGFWRFGAIVYSRIVCTGYVYQLKTTTLFHWNTWSSSTGTTSGTVTGNENTCTNAMACQSYAVYNRNHLACAATYLFTDQGSGYAAYKKSSSNAFVNKSASGPITSGSGYRPPEGGCK